MRSYVEHLGYGYSKRLCNDVSNWFIRNHLSRYKISVTILHRGLKREGVTGYCDIAEQSYRPREFLIEMDTYLEKEIYIKTLLHELFHLKQWATGSLQIKSGKMCYHTDPVESYDYENQPHEIEAHKQEQILYQQYLNYKNHG